MNYLISASTDIGTTKNTNQDSLSVKVLNTKLGKMAFAIMCDGMGGLAKGEVASATVIDAFNLWVNNQLPILCEGEIDNEVLKNQWVDIVVDLNNKIAAYGKSQGVQLGTTATVMLITETKYYLLNVGDSRAYEIADYLNLLTKDQTVVAREVEMGMITPEQAKTDSRRNVLLQCIGASNVVNPDFFYGETLCNAVYMLCTDGFRHEIAPEEIFANFHPDILRDVNTMKINADYLIDLNKQRQERDNISVVLVRTF